MQIKEFAEFTGVSVRTLHYYDEIGLLTPAFVERTTGYRFYDENSLLRMQEILFYRELDFSLKSIREILSSPNYNKSKALNEQKQLLMLKKERLERLISAIEEFLLQICLLHTYPDRVSEVIDNLGTSSYYPVSVLIEFEEIALDVPESHHAFNLRRFDLHVYTPFGKARNMALELVTDLILHELNKLVLYA